MNILQLLELFEQSSDKLEADETKNLQLKIIVDFFEDLDQKSLQQFVDPENKAYNAMLDLYDNVDNDIEEIEYDSHTYANIFLMYIALQKDPIKRDFALKFLLQLHTKYTNGNKNMLMGFADESKSNRWMPSVNALTIALTRKDMVDFLSKHQLLPMYPSVERLITDDPDRDVQDNINEMLKFYLSEEFKDMLPNILSMLFAEKDCGPNNLDLLYKHNPETVLTIAHHIARTGNANNTLFKILTVLKHNGQNTTIDQIADLIINTDRVGISKMHWMKPLFTFESEIEVDFGSHLPIWLQMDNDPQYTEAIVIEVLNSFNHIRQLTVSSQLPEHPEPLINALKRSSITSLILTDLNFTEDQIKHVSNLLQNNDKITELSLGNGSSDAERIDETSVIPEFVKILKNNKKITKFSIKFLSLTLEEFRQITDAIRLDNRTIQELNLENLNEDISQPEGIFEVAKIIRENKTITSLSLARNYIKAEKIISIAQALIVNKTIKQINLEDNGIGSRGAKFLGQALKQNNTITSLNLSRNYIDAEGIRVVAEALKVNKAITEIDLSENTIGPMGAELLGQALKQNDSITDLNLSFCAIKDSGVRYIAYALKYNNKLACLYIYSDNIGQEGLNSDNIGQEGLNYLAEALKNNDTLSELYLSEFQNMDVTPIYQAIMSSRRTKPFKCNILPENLQENINKHIEQNIQNEKLWLEEELVEIRSSVAENYVPAEDSTMEFKLNRWVEEQEDLMEISQQNIYRKRLGDFTAREDAKRTKLSQPEITM